MSARVVVSQGRFKAGSEWWMPRLISEFMAIHLVRTGQDAELERRLDRAAASQRNGIRIFGATQFLQKIHPSQAGYWAAVERVVELCAVRGLYVEACWGTDMGLVMPKQADRMAYYKDAGQFTETHPTVIGQIVNEPDQHQNWPGGSAVDQELLDCARMFRVQLAGNNYAWSIGDPHDSDKEGAYVEHWRQQKILAGIATYLVVHGSRKHDAARWSREVDHTKGLYDIKRNVGGAPVALLSDEPIGVAKTNEPGRRMNDPERIVALQLIGSFIGGSTYHYIAEQSDAPIGLDLCAICARVPASPAFKFDNGTLAGSHVSAFSAGFEKVRTLFDGTTGVALAYGAKAKTGTLTYRGGMTETDRWSSPKGEVQLVWAA